MRLEIYIGEVSIHKVMLTFGKFKANLMRREVDRYELQVYVDNQKVFDWYDSTDYGSKLQSYEIISKMLSQANWDALIELNEKSYSVSGVTVDSWIRQHKYADMLQNSFGWKGELLDTIMKKTVVEI